MVLYFIMMCFVPRIVVIIAKVCAVNYSALQYSDTAVKGVEAINREHAKLHSASALRADG